MSPGTFSLGRNLLPEQTFIPADPTAGVAAGRKSRLGVGWENVGRCESCPPCHRWRWPGEPSRWRPRRRCTPSQSPAWRGGGPARRTPARPPPGGKIEHRGGGSHCPAASRPQGAQPKIVLRCKVARKKRGVPSATMCLPKMFVLGLDSFN